MVHGNQLLANVLQILWTTSCQRDKQIVSSSLTLMSCTPRCRRRKWELGYCVIFNVEVHVQQANRGTWPQSSRSNRRILVFKTRWQNISQFATQQSWSNRMMGASGYAVNCELQTGLHCSKTPGGWEHGPVNEQQSHRIHQRTRPFLKKKLYNVPAWVASNGLGFPATASISTKLQTELWGLKQKFIQKCFDQGKT